ncbi:MAG: tRNA uridine-5-carboxymethylaminomethyl(34) synthesis GTPase MnmE [Pseudomonadota bacterium]
MKRSEETIVACGTARAKSGLAVVRVSGKQALHVAETVTRQPVNTQRKMVVRDLVCPNSGEVIDRCLVVAFFAPNSFTGEDVVEFHVHGSLAVIEKTLEIITALDGCRLAEAGQFTSRAFLNGKMDLTQVEGLGDLIEAETDEQRRQALRIVDGGLLRTVEKLSDKLSEALAIMEASLDFADETDVADDAEKQALVLAAEVNEDIIRLLTSSKPSETVRNGFRIVLAGPPNVGKSSILNRLAGRDAVIVSDQAGTTRDLHEIRMTIAGCPAIFIDSAGMRATMDAIEGEGIRRAKDAMKDADLVWWIDDLSVAAEGTFEDDIPANVTTWHVGNKSDIASRGPSRDQESRYFEISARTGYGFDALTAALKDEISRSIGRVDDRLVIRSRQFDCLQECQHSIAEIESLHESEIKAEAMRAALQAIGRLTGRETSEDILGRIFQGFCIGK